MIKIFSWAYRKYGISIIFKKITTGFMRYFAYKGTFRSVFIKIPLSLAILAVTISASALDVPQLTGRVNDYAAMLSPDAKASIENKLADLEKTDSTQIVVLTIPSLEGDVLEEYSIRVAEKWGIGHKKIDNGAILLIVKNDRKLRIEVGRGLEGKLTDLKSRRVISEQITPKFKAGDFSGGIEAGVDSLISIVKGEFQASDAPAGEKGSSSDSADSIFIFMIIIVFAVFILGKISKILGTAAGGIGGGIVASLFGAGLGAIIGLGVAGLLLGFIVSLISRSGGSGGGFSSGGGGFYSGGGGFGSSGGGGSFSGGGGSFGGGGSSGSW